ncbi:hypothetical protein LTS18_005732, partial [Coniosporium uncinatum]
MLFNLLWTNPRGHVGRLNDLVFLKGVTPGSESDKRYIYFTREDIDIKDSAGRSFGIANGRT